MYDFVSARNLIKDKILLSPLVPLTPQAFKDHPIYLKAECLQPGGSFKIRGATYALSKLTKQQREKGVVAYSTGNHAQAVALAAKQLNMKATIVMSPEVAPYKLKATQSYGAEVILVPTAERMGYAEKLAEERGAFFLPPFDHPDVITGQGTIGLEILDVLLPTAIYVPVGGGGLIAGIALAVKQLQPNVKMIGVEPELENDAFLSFKNKQLVKMKGPSDSIADAVKIPSLGKLTLPLILKYLDDLITVSEEEIQQAMKKCAASGLNVEPSGAIALAGALKDKAPFSRGPIVCIASGGSVKEVN